MAYVIWRMVMKKYSKVRLGLVGSMITPTARKAITYAEESWKSLPEDTKSKPDADDLARTEDAARSSEPFARTSEARQSKTKRVKNYLKKCKNALGGRSNSSEQNSNGECQNSEWYVDQRLEPILNESEVNEIEDVFECVQEPLDLVDCSEGLQVANIIEVKRPPGCNGGDTEVEDVEGGGQDVGGQDVEGQDVGGASPLLSDSQKLVDSPCGTEEASGEDPAAQLKERKDVASLVDKYFGTLYKNYDRSRKCLVRQARDLLVCEYRGCLQKFEKEFCTQASKLLHHLKAQTEDGCFPSGWPLCLGASGVVIHLSPLDPSVVRNRDCYLTLRNRSAPGLEVALVWRKNLDIHCHTIAEFQNPLQNLDDIMCSNIRCAADLELHCYDDYDGTDLPELLQNLLVSVEHAIERVPLDDLAYPCPQCLQYLPLDRDDESSNVCACQCSCRLISSSNVSKKDTSIQTSPMFEFAGSIPHIDSDAEDDKESIRSGCSSKRLEISRPKTITELPDKLLMSGINLPGTWDADGRPIILCYAECIARAGLNKYEIAKLLLYYASIPTPDKTERGFTILLLADNTLDLKVLQLLDKSLYLVANSVQASRYLIWRPNVDNSYDTTLFTKAQVITVNDAETLSKYLKKDQAPASCGGNVNHDQLEWVEFYKQLEPFLATCKAAGRTLLSTLTKLRNEEVPDQVTKRFLSHQCRQISKVLQVECLQKVEKEGKKILANLEERAQWLSGSADVKRCVNFAQESFKSLESVSDKLRKLEQERKDRLKELARLRTFKEEALELISWTHRVADETLNSLMLLLRSSGDVAGIKEVSKDFEKFFFNAWKQIEKSNELIEECKKVNDSKAQELKSLAENLQIQMKSFKERLEDTRVQLENTSRCFALLETCDDIVNAEGQEQEEFMSLSEKCKNEKVRNMSKEIQRQKETPSPTQPPDKDKCDPDESPQTPTKPPAIATSTPIKPQPPAGKRRSISSLAFIYHCNHHAAGEMCNCYESDNESSSLSNKLRKKYLQQLQSCSCTTIKDALERKNSATLDGIKEERESVEDLLGAMNYNSCRRCDSGVSTADNSLGEDSGYVKKKLQRTCSCHYYRESCSLCSGHSSSTESNQDNTENQQDSIIEEDCGGFGKSSSSDDIEDESYSEEKRRILPVPANKHLYCHASSLDIPSDVLYANMDPKIQKNLQYIIKEMIETERDYVKSLNYVIVNYIPELSREDILQALRGQRNTVFGNIEKIYEFHSQYFLRELEECGNNPLQVGQVFLKHEKKFYLYALYNKNKPKSDTLMSEYGTTFFKSKQIELGDKMDLASYLLKPVQRMGKYALLLQQMMKACPPPPANTPERLTQELDDLKLAEEMVRFQLRHGNDLLAMDSIRECDVNLKEQGRLVRQNEFLVWEGRSGKKCLRQVFLFEELILFSKAKRFPDNKNLDLYYYKNSIKMTDIGLTENIGGSDTKFEIWFRKRKPNDTYTLQSMSCEVKKAWIEELSQLLWKQAIKNRAERMAEMSSMGIGNKPCLDIKPNVNQISHRSITFEQLKGAPKFRNSISGSTPDSCRSVKRPQSVISMSSVSSGSTSSGTSGGSGNGQHNSISLSCESTCESPKPYHRSATLNSQCSVESGIIADMSMGSDECSEQNQTGL